MFRRRLQIVIVILTVLALAQAPLVAQIQQEEITQEANVLNAGERAAPPSPQLDPQAQFQTTVFCDLNRPSEVQRWHVVCLGGTQLDVQVADCCISGDHFEAKSKLWDSNPNTVVTTSPGPAFVFGVLSRAYSYGASINGEVDCSYIHGTGIFPMSAFFNISSDAASCTVTSLGKRDAINRTP